MKKEWRDEYWWHIKRNLPAEEARLGHIFMVESLEGREIEKAKKLGYQEGRIHVCNANPAVVATLKKRYPAIKTYGVDAARALGRAGVEFSAISLDFCSNLDSVALLEGLEAAGDSVKGLAGIVAVNFMRGRESADTMELLRKTGKDALRKAAVEMRNLGRGCELEDVLRKLASKGPPWSYLQGLEVHDLARYLFVQSAALGYRECRVLAAGTYVSRKVPMGWVVLRSMEGADHLLDEYERAKNLQRSKRSPDGSLKKRRGGVGSK